MVSAEGTTIDAQPRRLTRDTGAVRPTAAAGGAAA
jgi:hypothetical protein